MHETICGYYLDNQQQDIVLDESKHLLVVAGAGSGKTLTILGKIKYLVKYKKILPNEILCISFTRASANSLKDKINAELNLQMPVYTFHKLGLEILKEQNNDFEIADSNTLENIIHEFFSITVLDSEIYIKKIMTYFNYKISTNIKDNYLKFYKNNYEKIAMLEKIISAFLHLFKCNKFTLIDFSRFLKSSQKLFNFNKRKEKIFISIALNIYLIYENYLKENNEIDFDDMIINACNNVEQYGIKTTYKYVIIDEYQDTSYIRFLLIKAILNKTGAKLMVVGDDFQSIYRFTGCDVSLFLNFNKLLPNTTILKIENTYRNSQELITVAGNFVLKNKRQITKKLKSNKMLKYPVRIIYYNDIVQAFLKLVFEIYEKTRKPILVVGRNNNDIYLVLGDKFKLQSNGTIICTLNHDIKINYLTVHKSKGLEEENVIIINLEDKLLGFPSQIKDDKVLRFVNKSYDNFPYSEERRLFYVALTRTKNYVYLLTPIKNPSVFVKEIINNKKHIMIEKYC